MSRASFRQLLTLLAASCALTLAACGGGGGSNGGAHGPFVPDPAINGDTPYLVALSYDTTHPASAQVVLELSLTNVQASDFAARAAGLSVDVVFDPAILTFDSYTPNPATSPLAAASLQQGPSGRLVIAISQPVEGVLGTLTMRVNQTDVATRLQLDPVAIIGPGGKARADIGGTGRGGTLTVAATATGV
ncbi:MAG: hypothetical protein OEW11_10895 [Nitrospirota bacterium]|nr:hypothetical protein [Nitrospirota bacterium]